MGVKASTYAVCTAASTSLIRKASSKPNVVNPTQGSMRKIQKKSLEGEINYAYSKDTYVLRKSPFLNRPPKKLKLKQKNCVTGFFYRFQKIRPKQLK